MVTVLSICRSKLIASETSISGAASTVGCRAVRHAEIEVCSREFGFIRLSVPHIAAGKSRVEVEEGYSHATKIILPPAQMWDISHYRANLGIDGDIGIVG